VVHHGRRFRIDSIATKRRGRKGKREKKKKKKKKLFYLTNVYSDGLSCEVAKYKRP
jgi:hypothetical protein